MLSFGRRTSLLVRRRLTSLPAMSTTTTLSLGRRRRHPHASARVAASSSAKKDSFLSGSSSYYVDEMFRRWNADPGSVHASWDAYFRSDEFVAPPAIDPSSKPEVSGSSSVGGVGALSDTAKIMQLVRAFQVRGHFLASLDPLGIRETRRGVKPPKDLSLEYYGFTEADMDRSFYIGQSGISGFLASDRPMLTLREIWQRLNDVYGSTVGLEYMHIMDTDKCNWLRERVETPTKTEFTQEQKLQILDRLTWADHFELLLAKKFPTAKRFGLEGAESTIAGMKAMVTRAAEKGVDSIVLGMPHRGRLNVLANVVKKPMEQIFSEFSGKGALLEETEGSGDVKYHLGLSHRRPTGKGNDEITLTLMYNPSHLEAVNPVVMGKTRAKQFYADDPTHDKVLSVLLHGDAAFAGQGVVYESMGLNELPDFTVGGTIHLIVNNQIGFTTDPAKSRSTPYCTALGKAFGAPILHVNGDDPEAVVFCFELAVEWRQKFKKDIIVDVVCYRRHGHNEIDEPMFTQPHMYQIIKKQPRTVEVYTERLIKNGDIKAEQAKEISDRVNKFLEERFEESKSYESSHADWLTSQWQGLKSFNEHSPIQTTGVDKDKLLEIGNALHTVPEGFTLLPRLKKIYEGRRKQLEDGTGIDWAVAEALAFGTLLAEGSHVRLSGQDVQRGTFSHRHSVLHDQKTFETYTPLNHVSEGQAPFHVCNSSLSEFAVLGFEHGYSLENPNALVLWEAQFGDFANGGQVIFDQFISSGEAKWRRQSGLVVLLPHGYEGQGPEHSSGRLERMLQQCNDHPDEIPDLNPETTTQVQKSNWQVCNITSPANFFHALRRQIKRQFRKPLIVMTPKAHLRTPISTIDEFVGDKTFQRVLSDDKEFDDKSKVRRVLFCSGKVYFDLKQHRNMHEISDVAIVRVEQLSPFPFDRVAEEAAAYPNAEVVWVQEEPMNMGAWSYVEPRIKTALEGTSPKYVGRRPSASTAAGTAANHQSELKAFIEAAFAQS